MKISELRQIIREEINLQLNEKNIKTQKWNKVQSWETTPKGVPPKYEADQILFKIEDDKGKIKESLIREASLDGEIQKMLRTLAKIKADPNREEYVIDVGEWTRHPANLMVTLNYRDKKMNNKMKFQPLLAFPKKLDIYKVVRKTLTKLEKAGYSINIGGGEKNLIKYTLK